MHNYVIFSNDPKYILLSSSTKKSDAWTVFYGLVNYEHVEGSAQGPSHGKFIHEKSAINMKPIEKWINVWETKANKKTFIPTWISQCIFSKFHF